MMTDDTHLLHSCVEEPKIPACRCFHINDRLTDDLVMTNEKAKVRNGRGYTKGEPENGE